MRVIQAGGEDRLNPKARETAKNWQGAWKITEFVTETGEEGRENPRFTLWPKKPLLLPPARPKPVHRSLVQDAHEVADTYTGQDVCYFIGGDKGPIKIGTSSKVERRLRGLQAASPVLLKILAVAPGGKAREYTYHLEFAHWRLHYEWFFRHSEITSTIKILAKIEEQRLKAEYFAQRTRPAASFAGEGG